MSVAITQTKIRIPSRHAHLISRSRLSNLCAEILDYPFCLISAPAGYGKTSLMIDLAHQASYPVCWLSIDPLDKDPKRFLGHFIHSIKISFPEFGNSSLDLLNSLSEPLKNPAQFINTLLSDIYKSISENFVILIDDFHLLGDQPEIDNFISKFGQQMDENTHLVLSSRVLFSFPDLPLLVSRRQILGVDQEDLSFLPNELNEYLKALGQEPLSKETAAELLEKSAGWITGFLLREAKYTKQLLIHNKASKVTGANLEKYFSDEILMKQPNHVKKLLLQTSMFENFNLTICREILGKPKHINWNDFFDLLIDQNLFIDRVEDDDLWIRYHHLFRDFLRQTYSSQQFEESKMILNRLVNYYIERQDWENAFETANQLDDPEKMAQVVKLAYGPLFHEGRINLLAKWLEILPPEGFPFYPILFSLEGFTYTELGNPHQGLLKIENAIKNDQIKSNPELFSKTLVWRSTANRLLGNYEKAVADSFKAIRMLPDDNKYHHIKAEGYREIGLGFGRIGNTDKALKFLKKASKKYKLENRSSNLAQVHMDIGHVLLNMGKFKKAEEYFNLSIPHWVSQGNYIQLSIIMNNLGFLSTLSGNFVDANNFLHQGDNYAKLASSIRLQAFITTSKGDLAQNLRMFNTSIQKYENAITFSSRTPDSFLSTYIQISKATSYRYLNDCSKAIIILKSLEDQLSNSTSKYEYGLWHLEWGFLNLTKNNLMSAHESFQTSYEIFSGISRPYELAKSILGVCLIYIKDDTHKPLIQLLSQLESTLSEVETIQPILLEFSYHQNVIKQLLAKFPHKKTLEHILKEIDSYLENLPSIQKKIKPQVSNSKGNLALEIQGFGRIMVHKASKPINTSEWIHQKTVRELLYYLLSHPRGVTKDQIGLAFWPDSSPNQLNCQFKNAIYRLRRAIGKDYIIYRQKFRIYSFNWDYNYSYDVEKFQNACKNAYNQINNSRRLDFLRQAVAIYRHPFAPEIEGIWVLSIRRKLYLDYEKAQLEIANHELSIGNFTACKDVCLAILDIDPCQEEAYQVCMQAYSGLGKMTKIRRLFNQYKENLLRIHGVKPSNNILNLYNELTSK